MTTPKYSFFQHTPELRAQEIYILKIHPLQTRRTLACFSHQKRKVKLLSLHTLAFLPARKVKSGHCLYVLSHFFGATSKVSAHTYSRQKIENFYFPPPLKSPLHPIYQHFPHSHTPPLTLDHCNCVQSILHITYYHSPQQRHIFCHCRTRRSFHGQICTIYLSAHAHAPAFSFHFSR